MESSKIESIVPLLEITHEKPGPPAAPITIAVVGAGQRGKGYAYYSIAHSKWLKVVAVAEPNDFRRKNMKERYLIPDKNVFNDWRDLASRPKLCDAVIVATLDNMHTEPAIAFANLGYHILLEKPMAVTLEDCRLITEAVIQNEITFAVGHVLRYTPHNILIKRIIESGILGDIVNIQHMEPVGFWHYAHSYVRGNWRNEKEACFSLMTKNISSFGNLRHFRSSNKPKNAGDAKRCLDCAAEPSCPYSAKKIYLDRVKRGYSGWPMSVITDIEDIENVTKALENGPYGRCVYECDNDVVDNQVVNMEFENGATASIFGTLGELECDGMDEIRYYDFLNNRRETLTPSRLLKVLDLRGHGGGDFGLMESFTREVALRGKRDDKNFTAKYVKSGALETFDSHLYVFAAEHARKTGKVVNIQEIKREFGVEDFS
ncbi:2578_t:CDS:10 [Ambispora gerdemannii]|uniref:2578_t:CDS:1 n=1 Tax=Ambispora gerdemannii TaxID=144530 RepID=A0A9N9FEB6_9GLOM|nr:2578_t:CDS:10 [Ambispora gerdemannii]